MAKRARAKGLSDREAAFVDHYPTDWNGTQAAIRAGYAPKGAHVTASRLLSNPKIQAAIAERQRELAEAVQVEQVTVLRGLMRLAHHDPRQLVRSTPDGRVEMVPLHELPDDLAFAISGVKVRTFTPDVGLPYQVLDYKFETRKPAFDLLGRHLGMWQDVDKRPVEGTGVLRTPAPATAAEWSRVAQLQQAALGKKAAP